MPSPFPGMDPYLENPAFWPGFHAAMMTAIRASITPQLRSGYYGSAGYSPSPQRAASITPQLRSGYYAELDQHVWYREEEWSEAELATLTASIETDAITQTIVSSSGVAFTPPTHHTILRKIVREGGQYKVRIRDDRNRRMLAVIELLSPSLKESGKEWDQYRRTPDEFIANGTHMVEIDLLRDGRRRFADGVPDGDYYIYVTDAAWYDRVSIWVFTVRDPIPAFSFPLTQDHNPIVLSLRGCLDRVYNEANYGPQFEYHRPTTPPLNAADASWAADLLTRPPARNNN